MIGSVLVCIYKYLYNVIIIDLYRFISPEVLLISYMLFRVNDLFAIWLSRKCVLIDSFLYHPKTSMEANPHIGNCVACSRDVLCDASPRDKSLPIRWVTLENAEALADLLSRGARQVYNSSTQGAFSSSVSLPPTTRVVRMCIIFYKFPRPLVCPRVGHSGHNFRILYYGEYGLFIN